MNRVKEFGKVRIGIPGGNDNSQGRKRKCSLKVKKRGKIPRRCHPSHLYLKSVYSFFNTIPKRFLADKNLSQIAGCHVVMLPQSQKIREEIRKCKLSSHPILLLNFYIRGKMINSLKIYNKKWNGMQCQHFFYFLKEISY